ncbi:beta-lactamase family protein [Erythrobacter insulae]|uniref:Beta-lactamase family protein n=1 Tax=Erythrobacter insulae TaxID=2584124 RepID=A0A547P9I0_9SPHN|nr:serine hydrolase domain-containing protein [Erythrobacter insulae]TRD10793.1 beta-lactamase family protein [Erythrobacter insulae]
MDKKRTVRSIVNLILTGVAAATLSLPLHAKEDAPHVSAILSSDGTLNSSVVGYDRANAAFNIGSIGKFACTLAALRLSDQGLLDIDQPIADILPDFDGGSPVITTRHLLANRSGLPDGPRPQFLTDAAVPPSTITAIEAANLYASGETIGAPDETFSYNLLNWVVVQAVLEHASGRSFADLLQDTVLKPAGMSNSYMFVGQLGPRGQQPENPAKNLPRFLQCAGGPATTPADLLALLRFPHKGGLSFESLAALTTITTPDQSYTLGGRYIEHMGRQWSWQSGSIGPYKAFAIYDPQNDIGFAAMTASGKEHAVEDPRNAWLGSLPE